jgi:hypothetical protein
MAASVLLSAAWLINLAVAEWIIQRGTSPRAVPAIS